MTAAELKDKLKPLIQQVYKSRVKADDAALPYDELTKFPELKLIIIDLLTSDFDKFLESIDWVAPKPTTFRINLLNGQSFYLIYTTRSWIAEVEGKKYYLLNLNEQERATEKIARILRYGAQDENTEAADVEGSEDISVDASDSEETVEEV